MVYRCHSKIRLSSRSKIARKTTLIVAKACNRPFCLEKLRKQCSNAYCSNVACGVHSRVLCVKCIPLIGRGRQWGLLNKNKGIMQILDQKFFKKYPPQDLRVGLCGHAGCLGVAKSVKEKSEPSSVQAFHNRIHSIPHPISLPPLIFKFDFLP